ncbi:hypothetical protein ATO10_09833 [Actibacterium atlanticum]|uniref:Rhodanese domain-containing protein n=1 Tax=Actibacterium atlanticum TaxID=1461693 RepID=A0A058ZMW2_9RHOB|nr:rhodanese-like domain-containing protein [Actibacterium atlanticum]KCV82136.1 hypothetical protein ATO10_09833 [Actibacterium atlanticum]
MKRRGFLVGGAALVSAGAAGYYWTRPPEALVQMTPPQALNAVAGNALILVDIRRPDEWAATGVAQGAVAVDMRREDFAQAVRAQIIARPDTPVAMICARGVRSRRVVAQMEAQGLRNIIDIPEGMLGSRAGPGWLARGLPVTFEFQQG